ncbi:hypothetical protein N2152v2_005364 [Parachlorella kessleri]
MLRSEPPSRQPRTTRRRQPSSTTGSDTVSPPIAAPTPSRIAGSSNAAAQRPRGPPYVIYIGESDTALHAAARRGDAGRVRLLLQERQQQQQQQQQGSDGSLDDHDDDGCTALMAAAAEGRAKVVELLLQAGASLQYMDIYGRTAVHLAAAQGHATTLRLLLRTGADPNFAGITKNTPLHLAVSGGYVAAARALLAAGARQDLKDGLGDTPLSFLRSNARLDSQKRDALLKLLAADQAGQPSDRQPGSSANDTIGSTAGQLQRARVSKGRGRLKPPPSVATDAGVAQLGAAPALPGSSTATSSSGRSSIKAAKQLGAAGSSLPSMDDGLLARWLVQWSELSDLQAMSDDGSFGQVYTGKWQRTPVAVKVFKAEGEEGERAHQLTMRSLQQEAAVLAGLRPHPNIVRLLGICYEPPALVMELCGRDSLYDLLRRARRDPAVGRNLTWERRVRMLLDVARGMYHLHEAGLLHRDLKSPNVLAVDGSWDLRVADFNLSIRAEEAEESPRCKEMLSIHPRWLAPEVVSGGAACKGSDVFGFGVIMWELMTWREPWDMFQGDDSSDMIEAALQQGMRLPFPEAKDLPGPRAASFAGLGGTS